MNNMMRFVALVGVLASVAFPTACWAADPPQTFVVYVCSLQNRAAPLAGWQFEPADGAGIVNTCAPFGQFGMWSPDGRSVNWSIFMAPDVRVAAVRTWRSGRIEPPARFEFSALPEKRILENASTIANEGSVEWTGLDSYGLLMTLDCSACYGNRSIATYSKMELVIRDTRAPSGVGPASGSILTPGPLAGTVTLRREFVDLGGGLTGSLLLVDGQLVATSPTGCAPPYESVAPCLRSGMTEVSLDTSRVPDGEHHVRLILTDVAGNTAIADDFKITVKNATQPTALSAGSETAPGSVVVARPRQRVAHKTPVQVLGYVHDPTGGPIAGARVRFLVRDGVEGSAFAPEQAIVSDVDGKVELQLPPGVSRVVQLMYRDSVATQSIVVPAPVRLRISPKRLRNGQSIRLTGSVPGTTAGTRVELQARAGGKWVPFRSAALRNGAFTARYRFRRTFSRTTYRFRAVIHSDPHFPYAAAASPVVKVRVRP